MPKIAPFAAIVTLALLTAGCGANRFDRTVTGAGIGALGGAGAGALFGPIGVASGAVVGAGVGAGVGIATNERQLNLGRPIYR